LTNVQIEAIKAYRVLLPFVDGSSARASPL
jgi:hypothetical protein